MSALMIGAAERAAIAELVAVASAEPPFDAKAVIAMTDSQSGVDAIRDYMLTHSLLLPIGFRATYSREIQPNAPPPGLCHHLSVSVDRPGKLPSPEAVKMILQEFGMGALDEADALWIEEIGPGERAINVVKLVRR